MGTYFYAVKKIVSRNLGSWKCSTKALYMFRRLSTLLSSPVQEHSTLSMGNPKEMTKSSTFWPRIKKIQ